MKKGSIKLPKGRPSLIPRLSKRARKLIKESDKIIARMWAKARYKWFG